MNDLSLIVNEFGDLSAYTSCPPFWPATPDQGGDAFIASLKQASTTVIGQSAGGRDIIAIEYGEQEETGATCDNLSSAISTLVGNPDPTTLYPASFYGTRRRLRPSLCIQGGIHGGELTGTVAALNLCRIIETGRDLRDREWPELAQLARRIRLTIIPWLNIDGVTRWPLPNSVEAPRALTQRCQMGIAADGTFYHYPAMKAVFPIPPDQTAFMGSYFNDAGVNLHYDFCMPYRQPETLAWMHYFLAERPDAVLISHGNAGSFFGPPEEFLPVGFQHELTRIGGAVRQRLVREGLPAGRMSWMGLPGLGKPAMNQANAVYHVSGALPLLCEFPNPEQEVACSLDQLLDIGLLVLEETLRYGCHDGFRPYEWREKAFSLSPKAK